MRIGVGEVFYWIGEIFGFFMIEGGKNDDKVKGSGREILLKSEYGVCQCISSGYSF